MSSYNIVNYSGSHLLAEVSRTWWLWGWSGGDGSSNIPPSFRARWMQSWASFRNDTPNGLRIKGGRHIHRFVPCEGSRTWHDMNKGHFLQFHCLECPGKDNWRLGIQAWCSWFSWCVCGGVLVGDQLSPMKGDSAVCMSSFQNPWRKLLPWSAGLSGELVWRVPTWPGRPAESAGATSISLWARGPLPGEPQAAWWSCWASPTPRTTTATWPARSCPRWAGTCTTSRSTRSGCSRSAWSSTSTRSTRAARGPRSSPCMTTSPRWSPLGRTSTACSSRPTTPAGRRATTTTWTPRTCCARTRRRTSGTCCARGWTPSWWWATCTGATRSTRSTTPCSTSWRPCASSPATRWAGPRCAGLPGWSQRAAQGPGLPRRPCGIRLRRCAWCRRGSGHPGRRAVLVTQELAGLHCLLSDFCLPVPTCLPLFLLMSEQSVAHTYPPSQRAGDAGLRIVAGLLQFPVSRGYLYMVFDTSGFLR